jgi:zinc transport system permease protein
MSSLVEALSYEFMRNAVAAGVLASLLCGVIGTFVVVKRLAFTSGGISHAAFGGMGLAHFLGFAPLAGAVGAAVACSLALGLLGSERFRSHDAMIGVLWSAGMALGIVFIRLTPGYAPDLMSYLFGDILTVTSRDLAIAAALNLCVLAVVALLFKDLVAVAFDEPFAAVQGLPVRSLFTGLLVLTALSIVVLIQVVGIILVMALLTIPPLLALRIAKSFVGLMAWSVVASLALTLCGLALSYRYDLPSGPAIILLGAAVLAAVSGGAALGKWRRRSP